MTISDVLIILAVIIAPILAIQINNYLENVKEKKERKMKVFRTLMTTRATPISAQHVEALNMIDIEFFNNKKITDSWKALLDLYAHYPQNPEDPNYQASLNSCVEKSINLLTELLYEMSQELNYSFDKVHLKRGIYNPKGHTDFMQDQEFIRQQLVGVFLGKVPIPIKIVTAEDEQKQ